MRGTLEFVVDAGEVLLFIHESSRPTIVYIFWRAPRVYAREKHAAIRLRMGRAGA